MGLSAGIVGLPNVGKSTLFNTITNSSVEAANYPFATIEPNVGMVKVPDNRLIELGKLISPLKLTSALFTFVDIAGLVKGASKGEGLGNQFLANIREVDAICHVVRCFSDKNITHVYDDVDPIRDTEIINLELIMADLDTVEKRHAKIGQKAKSGDKPSAFEMGICQKILAKLRNNEMLNRSDYSEEEYVYIRNYNLLTIKPVLFIANIDEADVSNPLSNKYYSDFKKHIESNSKNKVIPVSVSIEFEISQLSDDDKVIFMEDMGLKETGLNSITKATYDLLGLETYFTFGKDETKAWTFKKGMTAPQCAGIIHSDFEKGFIKAEVMNWSDLVEFKTENSVKEHGKLRLEGKDYLMKDGDVVYFKFNV
ncbi:MAG: redox-regulated ATPase YchF [Mycoplasmataceae bacterium]|jgi:GTP-binding protein YchF|nr:redox-regulated ATPase YchF [Mycoplasmataceae bacterium]